MGAYDLGFVSGQGGPTKKRWYRDQENKNTPFVIENHTKSTTMKQTMHPTEFLKVLPGHHIGMI